MRTTKASAAEIVSKLSERAKEMFLSMAEHKTFEFKDGAEYGNLISELIIAGLIRSEWNLMTREQIFVINRSSRFVTLVLKQLREKAAA